jgi:hypothetical protein
MSLTLVGNNWQGEMVGQLATLITIGATDYGLFNFLPTKTGLVQFPYLTVNTEIQTFDSLCNITDAGGRTREILKATCVKFVIQETACYDEEFATDWANANGSYMKQTLGPHIATWVRMHVDNFLFGLQQVRWSGDTALPAANILSKHDGVAKKILAAGAWASGNPTGYRAVANTPVTNTNAIQEIGKVVDAIDDFNVKAHSGFKIIVSGKVANALTQQVRNNSNTGGFTSLPTLNYNVVTGQLADSTHFGAPIYVAAGLDAGYNNAIIAGVIEDSPMGVFKCAVLNPREGAQMDIRDVQDGDAVRFRAIHLQVVEVIPDLSQLASNLA